MSDGVSFLVGLPIVAVSIYAARRLAIRKGRLPGPWGLAALLVGPVAVLVLACMPARVRGAA
jgi:hypothetical protein